MTRKDYEMVQARIADQCEIWSGSRDAELALRDLAYGLAQDFAAARPEFDRARFLRGCGLED